MKQYYILNRLLPAAFPCIVLSFFLCACSGDPGYIAEPYKNPAPPSNSYPTTWYTSEDTGTILLDTISGGFEVTLRQEKGYLDLKVSTTKDTMWYAGDTDKEDVRCYFAVKFFDKKKKIEFPFHRYYNDGFHYHESRYHDRKECSSPGYEANRSFEWHEEIPISNFSKLKAGMHPLKCKLEVTLLKTLKPQVGDTIQAKSKRNRKKSETKNEHQYVYFPFSMEIPVIYLKKLCMLQTEMVENMEYDWGLFRKPDLYFILGEDGKNAFYRSETADQSLKKSRWDTVYVLSENLPDWVWLDFMDKDLVYNDYLGGYYIDFTKEDTIMQLPADSLVKSSSCWIGKKQRFN